MTQSSLRWRKPLLRYVWSVWVLAMWDSLSTSINVGTTSAHKELGAGPGTRAAQDKARPRAAKQKLRDGRRAAGDSARMQKLSVSWIHWGGFLEETEFKQQSILRVGLEMCGIAF